MRRGLSLWGLGILVLLSSGLFLTGADNATEDEKVLKQAGVATDGPSLLAYVKNQTLTETDTTRIKQLIKQLGDDDFEVREKASAQLAAIGAKAIPQLQQARGSSDIEVVRRAEACLARIEDGSSASVLAAVMRLLAVRKPAGTAELLLDYLPASESEEVKEAIQNALTQLALLDSKPAPALLAALTNENALRRRFAAVALVRGKAAEARPAVRKLLQDSDAHVRLEVALALVRAGEKDALPPLIALLDKLPATDIGDIEDVLYRLALEKAPSLVLANDAEGRRKYREAWDKWYKEEGDHLDLARLTAVPKLEGHTFVVLLDANKLVDLDAQKKPRWEIGGVMFPLDAQLLPGDRVLVAEHGASRVTERNLKGEVVWEKKVEQPLVAQRLLNGNTFIATPYQMLEVNKEGREVATFTPPGRGRVMKATRLPNGDIACITQLGGVRFSVIDRTGKELRGFAVNLFSSGGRIEILPNGNILIPEKENNRVVELNRQGKKVWEATVVEPINAIRLPDGHTLVTTFSQHRAVELDARGKEVWEYRTDTRVTRAWRH